MPPAVKITDGKKGCVRCRRTLPMEEFHRCARAKCGRNARCKDCYNKSSRKWSREKFARQPEEAHRARRNYDLAKYGLNAEQYDALNEEQSGLCAICRRPERKHHQNGRLNSLAVDHCHATGKVRGLLCNTCNRGIGLLGEDPALLAVALAYLEGSNHTLVQERHSRPAPLRTTAVQIGQVA
jgi:hypothetical protein